MYGTRGRFIARERHESALSAAQVRAVRLNPPRAPSTILRHLRHLRHCVLPIEAKLTAAKRLAHHHCHCVVVVIGVVGLVICVIASDRSNPTHTLKTTCAPSSSLRHRRHTDRSQSASRDPTRAPSKIAFRWNSATLPVMTNIRLVEPHWGSMEQTQHEMNGCNPFPFPGCAARPWALMFNACGVKRLTRTATQPGNASKTDH